MKRLTLAALILLVPIAATAFDETKHGLRIGVLRTPERHADENASFVVSGVARTMRAELRKAGYDAFTLDSTLDDLTDRAEGEARDADYYVEIISSDADSMPHGGVDVYGRHGHVSASVVTARVHARLRVYDGATLEPIGTHNLFEQSSAFMPVSVGVSGRHVAGWIALPFVQWGQMRRITRAVGREAAERVIETVTAPAGG